MKIMIKKYEILKKVNLIKELSGIIKIFNKNFSKKIKIHKSNIKVNLQIILFNENKK